MTYQLTTGDSILRAADNAFIPPDPANTDYQAYLSWLEEGNEPEPVSAPQPVPEPTPAERLAAAGLTVDDLKQLLGLTA
jgi:hypothetical protein